MGYSSRRGRRPQENASKSSHSYIVNDPTVRDFLCKCDLPKTAVDISLPQVLKLKIDNVDKNPINYVIAIDGGYSEVFVRKEFPSSTITFFQFGVLSFSVTDLEDLGEQPFIDPEDIPLVEMGDTSSAQGGEPKRSWWNPHTLPDEISVLGFDLIESLSPKQLEERYFAGRSDMVRPASHQHYAHFRRR